MSSQGDLFPSLPQQDTVIGGRYRLVRKISEGGGGVVWEALGPEGASVALKFLKWLPLKSQKVATDRFKNEFAILKSLAHPHISEIGDFGLDAATRMYFFTSELLTAGDLKSMVGAPVPVIEELLRQALRALEYLRGAKLLHLDIKPQNLLLRHDGEHPVLAIIDFGLATFRPPDRPGGTANYMPPELVVRRLGLDEHIGSYPPVDHRSDLYSLGVTFYYALTGIQPFCMYTPAGNKIDTQATMRRHLDYEPPPPSEYRAEIPPYLDRIVMKLMARHPDDRYPSAIVAAQALQYSSHSRQAPESTQTLLAYLPKDGRLIGRHRERTIIEDSLKDFASAKAHAAPIICIAGKRGTGRTRLLKSIKPFAQQLELNVIETEDGLPALAGIVGDGGHGEALPQRANVILIDDIERFMPNADEPGTFDSAPGAGQEAGAFARLCALIRKLRIEQRLKEAPGPRAFLIFTLDTDSSDIKRAEIDLNMDDSLCHTIELSNFTSAEVSEYLTALLGEKPAPSVIDQLMRCTDGNPLFITEHLEEMIAKGRLFSLAGRPDAKTLKTIGLDFAKSPPARSLAESISEKLAVLTEEAEELAVNMACWHRPASAIELAEASGNRNAARDVLSLAGAGLVKRVPADGSFSFVNALAARVIRKLAGPARTSRHHDAIALFLKGAAKHKGDEIDIHIAYGSNGAGKAEALERLIKKATDEHEPQSAAEHLEALIEILPEDDAARLGGCLARQGYEYEKARLHDEARASYGRIARIAARGEMGLGLRAMSLEHLGLLARRRRRLGLARRLFAKASDMLKEAPSMAAMRIRLENHLAGVDMRDGRFEEAAERFERTAAVAAKACSEEERRGITNNELGQATLRMGQVRRALEILKAELESAVESGDEERIASRHYLIGDAYRQEEIGDFRRSSSHLHDALKLARKNHMIEMQVRVDNALGNLNFRTGNYDKALEHYREGLKLAQQVEGELTSVELMIGMGLAAQKLSRYDDTIEYFEAALDFAAGPKGSDAGPIRRYQPTIFTLLGDAYYQKRDFAHSEDYLKRALSFDRKRPLAADVRYSLYGTYVELSIARGEIDAAKRFMPTLKAIAKSFPPMGGHYAKLAKKVGV